MVTKPNVFPVFCTSIDADGVGTITNPDSGQLNAQPPSVVGYSVSEGFQLQQFMSRQLENHLFGMNNMWLQWLSQQEEDHESRIAVNEGNITTNTTNISTNAGNIVDHENRITVNEDYVSKSIWKKIDSAFYIHLSIDPNLGTGDAVLPADCKPLNKYTKLYSMNDNPSGIDYKVATRFVLPTSIDITAGFSTNIGIGDKVYVYIVDSAYNISSNSNYFREGQRVEMYVKDNTWPSQPGERNKTYPAYISKSWDSATLADPAEITGYAFSITEPGGIKYDPVASYVASSATPTVTILPTVFEFNNDILDY